ncbi:hypothetical protein BDV96DRAFT_569567 [Lophiotrema nucula]|uniref:ATP-dependent DNA helicase n=1 Tax=Lophiotrema nucula TaxID=690887 RepID=A0A6A5ZIM0_9PLEO|nr:hypothetical protein BDV96DRAFT_569567 [Lophiotrema nucula]
MMESDDFGDLDDTAFLEAATQAEKENTPSFLPSPRPAKRRKIGHSNERTSSVVPRQNNNQEHVLGSSDDDAFEPALHGTALSSSRHTPNQRNGRSLSTSTASESPVTHKKAQRREGLQDGKQKKDKVSIWERMKQNSKINRIHTPAINQDLEVAFFTQPPQEHSPPWKARGAIWQKPTSIGIHRPSGSQSGKWTGLDAMKTMALPGRQSISSRPISRPARSPTAPSPSPAPEESPVLPTGTDVVAEVYDPALDLADLPSDAFASSSSSPQKHHGGGVEFISERRTRVVAPQTGLRQTTLFGREGVDGEIPPSQVNKRYNFIADQKQEAPTHHKLDAEAMKTWVYPTNLGKTRDYQFNIVARGLFHNLLVALPTGLGKTFIAATIMLNWFRWTTDAQIVFVAPTKPLVTQQAEACYGIVGIPRSETTLLIGGVAPGLRAEEWQKKRVFFMTPQTMLNDLKSGYADPKKIVLLVVDEAHRATGAYAYVEVVSFLRRFNQSFRVLALTATPGADVESVQKVIDGLDISRIELRTETSMDIREYVHQRKVDKHVFSNSEEMVMCMDLYSQALQPIVNKVAGLNAFYSRDPLDLTPYGCMQSRQKWMQAQGRGVNPGTKFMVTNLFTILGSISMGMELLKYHGIGPFYTKMKEFRDGSAESKSKYKKEVCDSDAFKKLMVRLQGWVTDDEFVGHPKLEFLQTAILDHFVNAAEGRNPDGAPPAQTRIMVFAHWRDSAEEIVRILNRHKPMIRPSVFVGQASAKNSDGMSQKEQQAVVEKFKKGTFNTLVATSIGEEGLDIGEVDLIICYDSKASPIRMLQRMGRTGRKREGKIILLQMEGKEEKDFLKAKDNYEQMQKLIADGSKFNFHEEISRRILPRDVQPVVDKRVVEIPPENSQADFMPVPKKNGRAPKRPPKKFHMPDGVITGFVTAGRMGEEIAPPSRGKKKTKPLYASELPAPIPPLDSVLLDGEQTKDLERRFQTVFNDDDETIGELNLGTSPTRQRFLSQTKHFSRPGRTARSLVETLQSMHDMDCEQLAKFKIDLIQSDLEGEPEGHIVVSEVSFDDELMNGDMEMWADDDPASQPLPAKAKAKPGPRPKPKAAPKPTRTAARGRPQKPRDVPPTLDEDVEAPLPKTITTPAPGGRPRKNTPATNDAETPAICASRGRGRPRKDPLASTTPARQPKARAKTKTPKTPRYRVSDLVDEGASSSPPPTDPNMRFASQADTIGSDDTLGADEPQDTQAYLQDSDLASFIADDEEEVFEGLTSSLPKSSMNGLGRGTQAVLEATKPPRRTKADKIFTSDPTDDDAIVSSDSDSDAQLRKGKSKVKGVMFGKARAVVVDSASEDDDAALVQPIRRARRIVDSDDEDG